MFSLEQLEFRYDPYPIGLARSVFEPDVYREMLDAWPSIDWCGHLGRKGQNKYYLNESRTKEKYHAFVNEHQVWREFRHYIKSKAFVRSTLETLREHKIDLGFLDPRPSPYRRARTALADVIKRRKWPEFPTGIYTRFEFSMLPADGGAVLPHTDDPKKIVTLVVYMVREGEWQSEWGGDLEIDRPRNPTDNFNFKNRKLGFDEIEAIDAFDYAPNQAVIFIKTFNSWHSVRPMTGAGSDALRRTLTINIETN